MKFKLFTIAAGITLLAGSLTVKAQKVYKEGLITYSISTAAGSADTKTYFKADSNASVSSIGPGTLTFISVGENDYLAVLVNVPVANMKKAAIATPAELEEMTAAIPELTFTTGTETKQISGFNCKKVTAKDASGKINFEAWTTTDITLPINSVSVLYRKIGGTPIQFQTYLNGQLVTATIKTVSDEKSPAGMFKVPNDFEKVTLSDLRAMRK